MQVARTLRTGWPMAAMLGLLVAVILALFAALSPVLSPAMAQTNAVTGQPNNIQVELVAEERPRAGETIMLALHFQPKSEEWHGYWSNPGDAGVGMALDWRLPDGWEIGEPLYPVPQKLEIAGLMNHVYEGDYAVLIPLSVPEMTADPPSQPIELTADYFGLHRQDLRAGNGPHDAELRAHCAPDQFAQWRAAIAPLIDSTARFATAGNALRLAIPLPEALALAQPHIFIENDRLVRYGDAQQFAREGDMLVAQIPLAEGADTPKTVSGILSFGTGDGAGVRFIAEAGDVPSGLTPMQTTTQSLPSLWLLLLGALAGGLLLNIMPCVFPILSLKALALVRAGGDEAEARRDGLAYTAGAVLACMALGGLLLILRAGGEQIGWAFQLQEPGIVVALLVLATVLTANFAGLFEFPGLPIRSGGKPAGSFVTGLLAAFVATPCTGPFMAAALGAALLLPPVSALLLFAALGLGLALPFLLLGFIPALRQKLPKPGAWMETFRRWMALPMGLTALALVWLTWRLGGEMFAFFAVCQAIILAASLSWATQEQVRESGKAALGFIAAAATVLFIIVAMPDPEPPVENADSLLTPEPFSRDALRQARASGQPVFLWFTADWCLTCKVNERVAIEREQTRAAFEQAGVIAMRGDWTRSDAEITQFLSDQGAAGVPLYLWYPAGSSASEQLPQILTPELLAEKAQEQAQEQAAPKQ